MCQNATCEYEWKLIKRTCTKRLTKERSDDLAFRASLSNFNPPFLSSAGTFETVCPSVNILREARRRGIDGGVHLWTISRESTHARSKMSTRRSANPAESPLTQPSIAGRTPRRSSSALHDEHAARRVVLQPRRATLTSRVLNFEPVHVGSNHDEPRESPLPVDVRRIVRAARTAARQLTTVALPRPLPAFSDIVAQSTVK